MHAASNASTAALIVRSSAEFSGFSNMATLYQNRGAASCSSFAPGRMAVLMKSWIRNHNHNRNRNLALLVELIRSTSPDRVHEQGAVYESDRRGLGN
jgi:hypothetical protein